MLDRARKWWSRRKGPAEVSLASVALGLALFVCLFFATHPALKIGSAWFALVSLWASALVAAELACRVGLPRAPAMVLIGLALAQIPNSATLALPAPWISVCRELALAVALLRGGLELEFWTIWRLKLPAAAYMLFPLIGVVAVTAGMAISMAQMPAMLAVAFGFVLNAVTPGIIVPVMLSLASQGYGIKGDVCAVAMLASVADEVFNLTGFAIFGNIALPRGESKLAWTILKGPVEVLVGVAAGGLLGVVCGFTKHFWTSVTKRCLIVCVSVLTLMSVCRYHIIEMMTGGAIGALMVGLVAPLCWERGFPKCLSAGPDSHSAHVVERAAALIWTWLFEPLLFVTIASDVVLSRLGGGVISKAIGIVIVGQVVRFLVAGATMLLFRYKWKTALFFAVAWVPKGTVQAALGSVPLTYANHLIHRNITEHAAGSGAEALHAAAGHPTPEDYHAWGSLIKAAAALSVAIFAAVGAMAVEKLAPLLLEREKTVLEQLGDDMDALDHSDAGAAAAAPNKDVGAVVPSGGRGVDDKHHADGAALPDQHHAPRRSYSGSRRAGPTLDAMAALRAMRAQGSHAGLGSARRRSSVIGDSVPEDQAVVSEDGGGSGGGAVSASGGTASVLVFNEHLRPTDAMVSELLKHPDTLKRYMACVHSLMTALAGNPRLLEKLPGGVRLTDEIAELQQEMILPAPAHAREMLRAMSVLAEVRGGAMQEAPLASGGQRENPGQLLRFFSAPRLPSVDAGQQGGGLPPSGGSITSSSTMPRWSVA